MSLPSPFTFLDWNEDSCTLLVKTLDPKSPNVVWGLMSVDGAPVDSIIRCAKSEMGEQKWLHNFAVMLPNYVLMSCASQAECFVITGVAHLELEDLETHEIEERTCRATEAAYDEAVRHWTHDKDGDEENDAKRGQSDASNNEENQQGEENSQVSQTENEQGNDEVREKYLEKRQVLDTVATLFDATNRLLIKLGLTQQHLKDAYLRAGGNIPTEEEEMECTEKDPATHAFMQEASARSGHQCQQQ